MSTNNNQKQAPVKTPAEREKARERKDTIWALASVAVLGVVGFGVGYYAGSIVKSE